MFYRKSLPDQRLWKSFISFDLIDCDPPVTVTTARRYSQPESPTGLITPDQITD